LAQGLRLCLCQSPPEVAQHSSRMEKSILPATAFDADRVPAGFAQAPNVAVVLPSGKYLEMMRSQEERSFNYHILADPGYSLADPINFDADTFVEAALEYCREARVDAIFGFDCFPAMLASIIKDELKLPGPASWSVFLCCNKYYLRRELTPELEPIHAAPSPPQAYPAVLKVSDTQFYVGTHICHSEGEWWAAWEDTQRGILAAGLEARRAFYFKWGTRHEWPTGWSRAEDVVLAHTEPRLLAKAEYQAEVVVLADGQRVMHDTGDIEKAAGTDWITVFKTPGTFTFTPACKAFLDKVAGRLSELGYRSGAMDVEFMRLDGAEEAYQLVEINSRYSYMGNYIHYGLDEGARSSSRCLQRQSPLEVRNLLNRTRLCLGAEPKTLACADAVGMSKLAAMVYTDHSGSLGDVFDKDALAALVDDNTLDGFAPKPVYLHGEVTEYDLRQYGGWAKICCLLMTWEDAQEDINAKLDAVVKKLFYGKDTGFLKVKVVDEDRPGATGLHPDALQKRPCCCRCVVS